MPVVRVKDETYERLQTRRAKWFKTCRSIDDVINVLLERPKDRQKTLPGKDRRVTSKKGD